MKPNRVTGNLKDSFFLVMFTLFIISNLSISVMADSDSRPATKAEKDFYRLTVNTAAQALPSCPNGWEITSQTEIKELQRVAVTDFTRQVGLASTPMSTDYHISWLDRKRKEEGDGLIQKALNDRYGQENSSSISSDNEARYNELAGELEKAFDAGDFKKAENIQKEMEKLAAKMNGVSQTDDDERNKIIAKLSPHDVEASITVIINSFSEDFNPGVKPQPAVAGGQVFRIEGEYTPENGWREGYTYVFIGKNWKVKHDGSYTSMEAEVQPGLAPTTAQTVKVMIKADPVRAKDILAKIKWDSLKKLIKM